VDQHNPKNKKPMTLKDFIHNHRGVNAGQNFPQELLTSIYHNIRAREIVMPDEHAGELKEDHEWKVGWCFD
jgi:brefeldin A-resistance guanine nucleotide exchange factor 1